ncbi:MAG TPA: hypothetical protein DIT25_02245 [Candidatus Moranbacteria bacterium]|nr:hypothetical protein [Candidatus Moranbacteria bacterium]
MIKEEVYLINCDTSPFCPRGWEVLEHKKGGLLTWDPDEIRLYAPKRLLWVHKKKRIWGDISGYMVKKRIGNKFALNANILDYLLRYPKLIPEKWKNVSVYFFGTIYHCGYDEAVRCLVWDSSKWRSGYMPLNEDGSFWGDDNPIALLNCQK